MAGWIFTSKLTIWLMICDLCHSVVSHNSWNESHGRGSHASPLKLNSYALDRMLLTVRTAVSQEVHGTRNAPSQVRRFACSPVRLRGSKQNERLAKL